MNRRDLLGFAAAAPLAVAEHHADMVALFTQKPQELPKHEWRGDTYICRHCGATAEEVEDGRRDVYCYLTYAVPAPQPVHR